jgi:hypothetical protein
VKAREWGNPRKTSVRIPGLRAEIWTRKLPNTKQKEVHVDGVRLCLGTAASNGPIVHPPDDMLVWRAMVECYWQGITEELGKNPVPVPLCPPQIPHGLIQVRTRASTVRRLTNRLSHSTASEEIYHLRYLHKDETIILKLILNKKNVRMWTGFTWFRIGPVA